VGNGHETIDAPKTPEAADPAVQAAREEKKKLG
jgi:hypothetical protein